MTATAKELQKSVRKLNGSLGEINRKIKLITEKTISEVERAIKLINGKLDGNAINVKNELTVTNEILKRLLSEAEEITKEVELAEKNINDIISAGTNVEPKAEELIAAIEAEEKQKEESRGNTNIDHHHHPKAAEGDELSGGQFSFHKRQ